jgi:hypothetical protein
MHIDATVPAAPAQQTDHRKPTAHQAASGPIAMRREQQPLPDALDAPRDSFATQHLKELSYYSARWSCCTASMPRPAPSR